MQKRTITPGRKQGVYDRLENDGLTLSDICAAVLDRPRLIGAIQNLHLLTGQVLGWRSGSVAFQTKIASLLGDHQQTIPIYREQISKWLFPDEDKANALRHLTRYQKTWRDDLAETLGDAAFFSVTRRRQRNSEGQVKSMPTEYAVATWWDYCRMIGSEIKRGGILEIDAPMKRERILRAAIEKILFQKFKAQRRAKATRQARTAYDEAFHPTMEDVQKLGLTPGRFENLTVTDRHTVYGDMADEIIRIFDCIDFPDAQEMLDESQALESRLVNAVKQGRQAIFERVKLRNAGHISDDPTPQPRQAATWRKSVNPTDTDGNPMPF